MSTSSSWSWLAHVAARPHRYESAAPTWDAQLQCPPNQGSDHHLGSESGDAAQRADDHWALRIALMAAPDGVVIAILQWVAAGKTLRTMRPCTLHAAD